MKKTVISIAFGALLLSKSSHAQTPDKPAPAFTLKLAEEERDGTMPGYQHTLIVTYTNISNGLAPETNCGAFGYLYKLDVVYNGTLLPELTEKRRTAAENGHCTGGSNPGRNLQPRQSRQDTIHYNAFKPGTYEFTVEENTFPLDTVKNVVVRSNTVTIVVPRPEKNPAK